MLTEFNFATMGGQPHNRTQITSRKYGLQARNTCPVECWEVSAALAAALSSYFSLSVGFQNMNRTTSTPSAPSEAMRSVSCGPTKLEIVNCKPAKVTPHSTAAGKTRDSALQPPITTTR